MNASGDDGLHLINHHKCNLVIMDASLNVPFFSIILPVYNGEKSISETIQSILQQSFPAWELIIVNDGSTDNTVSIINDFCSVDTRIKLLHQANKKQPAARNTGIKVAAGQWLAFIDADDVWLPAKLTRQYQCIKANDGLDVIFSDGYTKYHDKVIRHYYHYELARGYFNGKDLYKKMMFGNYIPILSAVVKMSWVVKIGMQDETVPGVEDHDYWLKLCRAGAAFYGMEDRLFEYRVHENNFSANLVNQHYLSLVIRMNNYEPLLLGNQENKQFSKAFHQYINYFENQGKTAWVQELKERFRKLPIPPVPVSEQIKDRVKALKGSFRTGTKQFIKRWLFLFVKIFYFYPKKRLFHYRNKLAISYVYWLNFKHIKNYKAIQLSATATVNFYNVSASIDTQELYVGDFSRINFMEEHSKMITGAAVTIGKFCNFNIVGELIMGNNVLFNNHSTLTCHGQIVIGDDTWFGEGVRLYDHNHNYKDRNVPFTQQGYTNGTIKIGNNVWVGSNSIILNNVTIGDGCVIGANNVIYKSLPANTIVKSKSMDATETIPSV
ncbi:MAG: glycosyltransferase [Ferruginibacter sp.]